MRAHIPDPKAQPVRLVGALILSLALAGCGQAKLTVEVAGLPDAQGQVRLCDQMYPLNPVGDLLTATVPACKGKGDILVAAQNAQFAHCDFADRTTGKTQTLKFRIAGVDCVAAP